MKKVVFSITMLSVLSLNAQTEPPIKSKGAVGINTHEPRATLDINGNLRLQEIKLMTIPNSTVEKFTECPCVFIIDQFGVVKRIPLSQLTNVGGGSGGGTGGSTPPSSGGGGTGSTPPPSGGGGTSGTPPSSGGGTGSANMETTQTIYIPSIKDTGVDYQGIINNTAQKIRFTIPYTNGNNGTYNAVNTTVTSNVVAGENGDSNPLQLTIDSGTFASTGGKITGTITVGGDGTLNVKKQKVPTSASDFEAKKLNVATINFKLGTKTYSLKIAGVSAIPDRCFGKTTLECVGYGANEKEHEFLYLPITGPDGRTWLNNNLGAEYARVGSPWFNPTRQAGAFGYRADSTAEPVDNPTADQIKDDWRAFGSLFQWQRKPDGHELIYRSGDMLCCGVPKYNDAVSSNSNSWTNPNTNNYIIDVHGKGDYETWVSQRALESGPFNLWQSGGENNPCPAGFHVPTENEQVTLLGSWPRSGLSWIVNDLRMPAAGGRVYGHDQPIVVGYGGIIWAYWSSFKQPGVTHGLSTMAVAFENEFWSGVAGKAFVKSKYIVQAFPIRCIKD